MKPGLVIFSPMPPLRNGIADYTARLLPFHAREFDCVVILDDASPEPTTLPADVVAIRVSEYRRHAAELGSYRHLFHVGNNSDHIYMLPHLRAVAGLVVCHDLMLHHLMCEAYLDGVDDRSMFTKTVWAGNGYAGRVLAEQAIGLGWRTVANYLELDGRRSVIAGAAGVIVHSMVGLSRVKATSPNVRASCIQHFAELCADGRAERRFAARRRLRLPHGEFILLSLGFVTNAKQITTVMDAIKLMATAIDRPFLFLVAGEERDFSVGDEAKKRGLENVVRYVGYTTEEEIGIYLDAADVLLNLRYPTQGETSGSLCRALGRGTCAIVSNHGWYGELPDAVVVKVPARADIADVLAGTLFKLLRSPLKRSEIETAALHYVATELDVPLIAAKYNEAIRALPERPEMPAHRKPRAIGKPRAIAVPPSLKVLQQRASALSRVSRDANDPAYVGLLWWAEELVPLPDDDDGILISGPVTLEAALSAVLGTEVTPPEGRLATRGLYVGSWDELLQDGTRLSAFADKIDYDGLVLIDLWANGQDIAVAPMFFSDAEVSEILVRFGLDTLAVFRLPAHLAGVVDEGHLPLQECAFLAQKAILPEDPAILAS